MKISILINTHPLKRTVHKFCLDLYNQIQTHNSYFEHGKLESGCFLDFLFNVYSENVVSVRKINLVKCDVFYKDFKIFSLQAVVRDSIRVN